MTAATLATVGVSGISIAAGRRGKSHAIAYFPRTTAMCESGWITISPISRITRPLCLILTRRA